MNIRKSPKNKANLRDSPFVDFEFDYLEVSDFLRAIRS